MAKAEVAKERAWAVATMRLLHALSPARLRRLLTGSRWPPLPGTYTLGDSGAPVAVCTLTDGALIAPMIKLPGVAIAGRVYTANLGIERIVINLTTNAHVRFLVLCGRDSALFRPGQTLQALFQNGVSSDRRVVGAAGYLPVLSRAAALRVPRFRRQIEVIDRTGNSNLSDLEQVVAAALKRNPGPLEETGPPADASLNAEKSFVPLRPGGKREPLAYDPKGYFVITIESNRREIVVRHYLPDNTPAHEMRGRDAEPILLGLLREGLVSQLSHAGYLGAELAKAEAALRLDLDYEQDRPVRSKSSSHRPERP
jgi:tetrahydromethanopterin S-methyltransferase subunit A